MKEDLHKQAKEFELYLVGSYISFQINQMNFQSTGFAVGKQVQRSSIEYILIPFLFKLILQKEEQLFRNITDSMDMNLSKLQEAVKEREAWLIAVHGITKSLT